MEYDMLITIQRKNKEIVFFIKGDFLSVDNIVDVEIHNQPERSKREDLERGCGALNSEETH